MPSFKVIRASAGSGKTFLLTGEYLRLLFAESDAFRHILAVTFTNKATEEMKSRIIHELYALSANESSKQLPSLIAATGLTEEQIRNGATTIIKKLLHSYSSFSVTTIDSFFQRIIRNFTRELGIQEGYAIELDTGLVLKAVIDRLMVQAEQDKSLLHWLTLFAESLIEKGESWNIRNGIFNLGKEIFREEFKSLNESSRALFSDRQFLKTYREELYSIIAHVENTCRDFGKKASAIFQSHHISVDEFCRKGSGPAGFLVKLSGGNFIEPNPTALQASMSPDKWYTSASPRRNEIHNLAVSELMPLMNEVINFHENNKVKYYTASVIIKNLYTLGILIDLSVLADAWCSENNTFLLPEAPVFLNKIIDGNDTPFIYEKAGCWYHHFMIDEFQDTSLMQWLNFKPLISNSLSMNYDNLAVGDTKQSIYRWRNSNWEILEKQIYDDFLPGIIESISLRQNWRSLANIIAFNNDFFPKAASLLQGVFENCISGVIRENLPYFHPITELYSHTSQQPGKIDSTGGYVRVRYFDNGRDEDYYQLVNCQVLDLVYELLETGYQMNDIAILTRKNSEASMLADFLLKSSAESCKTRLDVISDEALRLGNSVLIHTVIGLLTYHSDPSNETNNYHLLSMLSNYLTPENQEEPWICAENHLKLQEYLPQEFIELSSSGKSYSLTEIVERIIKIFSLNRFTGEQVYLTALRDVVIEYSKYSGSDVTRFLEYWSETGCDKSVAAPPEQDAIRILTLHKSKGLEFKITIIPYCTWELNSFNKSFMWCSPKEKPFDKLPLLPLNFTNRLEKTIFAGDYYKEYQRQLTDNLNLLYVAFTRAREAMFVFCKKNDKEQVKTVSDVVRQILGNDDFSSGFLNPVKSEMAVKGPDKIQAVSDHVIGIPDKVKIAFQGNMIIEPTVGKPSRPVNDGKIMHEVFTLIRTKDDIKTAVARLHLQGKIAELEQAKYISMINKAMNDLQVASWFTGDWELLNEAEIILPGGIIKRPDRVMVRNGRTTVIDYKFGLRPEPENEKQIREYAEILVKMGYQHVDSYLWYGKLGKVVQVL